MTPIAHIALLGDSIFDNKSYVGTGPDVVTQLREILPTGWHSTLVAVDGSTTRDMEGQLVRITTAASHLVVSMGGNDALGQGYILQENAKSVAEALQKLRLIRELFETNYRKMLQQILALGLPTTVCTVYDPRFPDPHMQQLCCTALNFFNDVILRAATEHRLPVIDLRLVCNDDTDYANPIEPSVMGGQKIARTIVRVIQNHDFRSALTTVYW